MYRCQRCATCASPGTPAHRSVLETRARRYPRREDAHVDPQQFGKKSKKKRKRARIDDPGGAGFEIARERLLCPDYASAAEAESP